jgi:meso-butanediol dehydrogenase/(S,S)-butanediol dehydrogenase/diacetyl reductase
MSTSLPAGRYGLTGKTVVITGAGSGIGRAVAHAFAAEGANVVIAGRRMEALEQTAAPFPDTIIPTQTDVQDAESVRALLDGAADRFGSVDVVISNAAGYTSGPLEDIDGDTVTSLVATNVTGALHLAQASIPHLKASRGTLLFTTSVSALRGDWGQSLYNATKGALTPLMQSLALDLGEFGVRVNAVAPAATRTEMTEENLSDERANAAFKNRVALGRVGEPDDIAPAYLFLASNDAAYITGVTLPVDGGTSASTGQPHFD